MGSQMTKKSRAAFTLAEMIVVLIILSVIAAVALPQYNITVERFRAREAEHILLALFGAQKRYAMEHGGNYTNSIADMDITLRYPANFSIGSVHATNPLARMTRSNGSYVMCITNAGVVTCDNNLSLCTRLGFTTGSCAVGGL